jgi:hypothetical protein
MPAKITKKKRLQMYAAWTTCESVTEVCAACEVDERTLRKYRKLDQWDKKLDRIRKATFDKIDLELGDAYVKQVRALTQMGTAGLRTWLEKIGAGGGKLDCSINELLGILRLQQSYAPSPDQSKQEGEDTTTTEIASEIKAGLDLLRDQSGSFIRDIGRALARRGTDKDIAAPEPRPRKAQRGKGARTCSARDGGGPQETS